MQLTTPTSVDFLAVSETSYQTTPIESSPILNVGENTSAMGKISGQRRSKRILEKDKKKEDGKI
jgi:hypothetical protein